MSSKKKKRTVVRDPAVLDDARAIARRSNLALFIRTGGTSANMAIRWGVIGFLGYTMTPHLAGKLTRVSVAVSRTAGEASNADSGSGIDWLHCLLAVLVVFLAVSWVLERINRKHVIEVMSIRNSNLEARLDPKRSSSGLKPDGSSPEEE